MRRKATMLFAVAIAGPAAAEPATPVQPRVLATGQPACGNVMLKSPQGGAVKVILTAIVQEAQQIRRHLIEHDPPLTLAMESRPRP